MNSPCNESRTMGRTPRAALAAALAVTCLLAGGCQAFGEALAGVARDIAVNYDKAREEAAKPKRDEFDVEIDEILTELGLPK